MRRKFRETQIPAGSCRARTALVAVAAFASLAVAGCGEPSQGNSAGPDDSKSKSQAGGEAAGVAGGRGSVKLAASAPDWCHGLISNEVQQMAAAMPAAALGSHSATQAAPRIHAGTSALRLAAGSMPTNVAQTARATAAAVDAYIADPGGQRGFHTALQTLNRLAIEAHQECGL